MNPHVEQLAIPYQRSMTFLSYIQGPLVNDWVEEQAQWLIDQTTGGVAHAEENLWQTIKTRFCQAYTDTAEKQKALPFKLVANCVKFDHPVTWNNWTASAQKHQQEYIFFKERVRGNDRRGG